MPTEEGHEEEESRVFPVKNSSKEKSHYVAPGPSISPLAPLRSLIHWPRFPLLEAVTKHWLPRVFLSLASLGSSTSFFPERHLIVSRRAVQLGSIGAPTNFLRVFFCLTGGWSFFSIILVKFLFFVSSDDWGFQLWVIKQREKERERR